MNDHNILFNSGRMMVLNTCLSRVWQGLTKHIRHCELLLWLKLLSCQKKNESTTECSKSKSSCQVMIILVWHYGMGLGAVARQTVSACYQQDMSQYWIWLNWNNNRNRTATASNRLSILRYWRTLHIVWSLVRRRGIPRKKWLFAGSKIGYLTFMLNSAHSVTRAGVWTSFEDL